MQSLLIYKFTNVQRNKLNKIIMYTYMGLIVFDVIVYCILEYMLLNIENYTVFIKKALITRAMLKMRTLMYVLIVYHIMGVFICDRMINIYRRQKYSCPHRVYAVIIHLGVVGYLFILSVVINNMSNKLIKDFKEGFVKQLVYYEEDKDVNYKVNKLQNYLQCCGANNFQDYHRMLWLNTKYINLPLFKKRVQQDRYKGIIRYNKVSYSRQKVSGRRTPLKYKVIADTVPVSCCKINHTGPCENNFLYNGFGRPNRIKLASINKAGCLDEIKKSNAFMFILVYRKMSWFIFFFHLFCWIPVRLIQTSIRRSVRNGFPRRSAYGYLFIAQDVLEKDMREKKKEIIDVQKQTKYSEDGIFSGFKGKLGLTPKEEALQDGITGVGEEDSFESSNDTEEDDISLKAVDSKYDVEAMHHANRQKFEQAWDENKLKEEKIAEKPFKDLEVLVEIMCKGNI